jgi:hypothetical protein
LVIKPRALACKVNALPLCSTLAQRDKF